MLYKIIKNLNYDIIIDKNYKSKDLLITICKKYKKNRDKVLFLPIAFNEIVFNTCVKSIFI